MSSGTKTAKQPKNQKGTVKNPQSTTAQVEHNTTAETGDATSVAEPVATGDTEAAKPAPDMPNDSDAPGGGADTAATDTPPGEPDLIPEETELAFTAEQEAFLAAVARVKEALPGRTTLLGSTLRKTSEG